MAVLEIRCNENVVQESSGIWFSSKELEGLPQDSINRLNKGDVGSDNENRYWLTFKNVDLNNCLTYALDSDTRKRIFIGNENKCMNNAPLFKELVTLRFFVFNLLMRRRANRSARFYVSKASGLKDLSREELTDALLADESLLPQIVWQGSTLSGTRPFWRSKSGSLQAQARFLSPNMSPVFVTFSAADMQWQDLHRHFPGWADVATADDRVRRKFVWDRVQDHPHLIAHYLVI
jgi:hypothetical protein